ncbi:SGNH/GDSL hydrolase family protein [Plebeiibacterium marinum]|uniref:GDSL-type esterase/lipase family protein n=1 Tax=Plebeiibacterium marinum TaxID=2992111 RepID=A0AAE3SKB2_9BACT|nr:SGNH/GDSL hydrolase family protein [Plebeiobacterium marinum]MCW3806630.1 GDSL-type esterase/lipase family protein [Plebeiobacterium marinum]
MQKISQIFILISVVLLSACSEKVVRVAYDNTNLTYEGRIVYQEDAAEFSWPGTSVTMQFEGTGVSATLQDLDTANYYNVIVDGEVISKIHTDSVKQSYQLASGLSEGKHIVQLFKRTEWDKGKTLFYGFKVDKGGKLLPAPEPKKRKIEFYGNSITCGFGNEDYSGKDRWFGYFQNNYETYGAITARHFDAQYSCIAKSGIGIVISWFPMIMPEMYDRVDATDSTSVWDFSQYTPDVVVVNLFQNDSWLVNRPEHESFKSRFGTSKPDSGFIIESYKQFISSLRSKYPDAHIICALGNMDATREGSEWPGYIQTAVDQMGDSNLYTCFFPFKNTGGHPKVEEQQAMAKQLIGFIEENIEW